MLRSSRLRELKRIVRQVVVLQTVDAGPAISSEDVQLSLGPSKNNIMKVPFKSQENSIPRASLGHNYLRSKAEVIHGPRQATLVNLVYWTVIDREHSLACIKCLAITREVLLVSARRPYAWIAEGTNPAMSSVCSLCGELREANALTLNIYPMRPISIRRIVEIFFRYGGMSSNSVTPSTNTGAHADLSYKKRKAPAR
uniref:AlNc14C182G8255 protein n=1 Tax=Albugo laibachii Nc14 TaxID=890382 RepID=F0WPA7_9STRA|nr:AlNc14C182G8255 [Albugo laibachii Nc14]|eukprot:CCA23153.1 AlNc14C182G8255 [Albugo laibachii Nc14]